MRTKMAIKAARVHIFMFAPRLHCSLTARGESLAAFDGRCIPAPPQRGCRVGDPAPPQRGCRVGNPAPPQRGCRVGNPAGCVAPRSNTPGTLGRRALPWGRLARLGATPDFRHGLLTTTTRRPTKTRRAFVVAFLR